MKNKFFILLSIFILFNFTVGCSNDVTPKNRTRSNVSKYDKLLAKEKRNGKEKLHS